MKPGRASIERAIFFVSTALLAFLYGIFTSRHHIFPEGHIDRAIRQGKQWYWTATHHFDPHNLSPLVYHEAGARTLVPGRTQPGLTLLTSYWKDFDWRPGVRLIDADGRVLHAWKTDPTEIWPGERSSENVHGTYLFPNGDILFNIEYVSLARMDACGKVKWALDPDRYETDHAISRNDDGTFWVVSGHHRYEESEADQHYLARYPPLTGELHDMALLKVTPDGEVLQEVDLVDVLYRNNLQFYIAKMSRRASGDVFHLNDVEPLRKAMADQYPLFKAGDLVVSVRNLNLVMVFDPDTGVVKWHATGPFIQQHDPDFIGDGWIGIFDNHSDLTPRGTALGGSRIVAIRPDTGEVRVLYPKAGSAPFYTDFAGKWQLLENGNMLITEALAGHAFEVTPDGATVWEWSQEPYSADLVAEVMEASRYDLTPEQVAAWPCSPAGEETRRLR